MIAFGNAQAGPLRIGLPKGSLYSESLDALERAGILVDALRDPGRQLIFRGEDFEFVILRPTDVPVFVASGGTDCAICGEDSIIESGLDVVEMLDLGFGACRFVVAEPDEPIDSDEGSYERLGVLRVATKYPRITRQYYDSIGVQVEIIKLHGNIELAPLCGMASRIVDITATGTTLRENKLHVVEEVMHSTARFIANPATVRVDNRIRALAQALKDSL